MQLPNMLLLYIFKFINWRLLYFVIITNDLVMARPSLESDLNIQSEIIDPANRTIWAMFNLTDAQLNRVKMQINSEGKNNNVQRNVNFDNIKEFRTNDVKRRLELALKVGNSEESQEHPTHEQAFYPLCSSDSNESSWQHDNNVTIRFSDSIFETKDDNLNLDSAILRLYKVNPNATITNTEDEAAKVKPRRCAEQLLDSQIRITVSVVHQLRRNKRERRKRIFNTMMISVSKTGWIEIDIKRAFFIWESPQQSRQQVLVGWLIIEVHDEEDRPLKPGLYFQPPKCDQADFAIPWNYYGPQAARSSFTANKVPRYPRLDVKLIGYASFAPKNFNKQLHEKLRENLRRQILDSSNNVSEQENETLLSSEANLAPCDMILNSSISTESKLQTHDERLHNHHKRHLSKQIQKRKSTSEDSHFSSLKDKIDTKNNNVSLDRTNYFLRSHNGHKRHNNNHHHRKSHHRYPYQHHRKVDYQHQVIAS